MASLADPFPFAASRFQLSQSHSSSHPHGSLCSHSFVANIARNEEPKILGGEIQNGGENTGEGSLAGTEFFKVQD